MGELNATLYDRVNVDTNAYRSRQDDTPTSAKIQLGQLTKCEHNNRMSLSWDCSWDVGILHYGQ